MSVPFTRTLPYVLREQLKAGQQLKLLIGEVVSSPDTRSVQIVVDGQTLTIPRLTTVNAPTPGDPEYVLVGPSRMIAIGSVGDSAPLGIPVIDVADFPPSNPIDGDLIFLNVATTGVGAAPWLVRYDSVLHPTVPWCVVAARPMSTRYSYSQSIVSGNPLIPTLPVPIAGQYFVSGTIEVGWDDAPIRTYAEVASDEPEVSFDIRTQQNSTDRLWVNLPGARLRRKRVVFSLGMYAANLDPAFPLNVGVANIPSGRQLSSNFVYLKAEPIFLENS